MRTFPRLSAVFAGALVFALAGSVAFPSGGGSGQPTRNWRSSAGGRQGGRPRVLPRCSTSTGEVPQRASHQCHGGGRGRLDAKAVLATRMRGGNPPDSFQVHAGHELIDSWVMAGKMEPITFVFKDNGWLGSFPRGLIDIISWKGEIYSVPVNIHRSKCSGTTSHLCRRPSHAALEPHGARVRLRRPGPQGHHAPGAGGQRDMGLGASSGERAPGNHGVREVQGPLDRGHRVDGAEVQLGAGDIRLSHALREYRPRGAELGRRRAVRDRRKMRHDGHGRLGGGLFQGKGSHPQRGLRLDGLSRTHGAFIMLSDSFGLPRGRRTGMPRCAGSPSPPLARGRTPSIPRKDRSPPASTGTGPCTTITRNQPWTPSRTTSSCPA